MRLVIAGPRVGTTYTDVVKAVDLALAKWGLDVLEVSEVVSGGCHGTDLYGEKWAEEHDIPIKQFKPNWSLGKVAGPIRNKQMAVYGDYAAICWDGESRGSLSMIKEMKRAEKPAFVYMYKEHRSWE